MAFPFGPVDYRAQISELENELQKWKAAIHGKIKKACELQVEAIEAKKWAATIEKHSREKYSELTNQIEAAGNAKMEAQRDRDDLLTKIQRLKDEVEAKELRIKHVEDQAGEIQEELTAEKALRAELHEKIRKEKVESDGREKYIAHSEAKTREIEKESEELQKDKDFLQRQLDYEKVERSREQRALGVLQTRYDKLRNETQGVRDLLTKEQAETARLTQHNKELQETILALEHVQAEIVQEKKISQGLRAQWDRLRDELPRFNPSPQVAIAPPAPPTNAQHLGPSKTPQSLANELDGIGSTSSSGSSHESGTESAKVSSSDSSDSSSSSSSEDDDDNDNETEVGEPEIKEVIREVQVPGPTQTIRVCVPFQTTAHSSIMCWFMVEVNLFIIFRLWLSRAAMLAGRAVPWLQSSNIKAARGHDGSTAGPATTHPNEPAANGTPTPIAESAPNGTPATAAEPAPGEASSSAGPSSNPPNPPTVGIFSAAGGTAGEQEEIPGTPLDPRFNRIAELIEPVVPNDDGRAAYPPGERPPQAAHIPRHWFGINIEPYRVPPVFSTLVAFASHMIFYWFLYVCYRNYCEREIWLEANDAARRLVVDILALRAPDGRGIASHLFSEQVVSRFDRFVLATFSTVFKIEPKPWNIPG